MGRKVGFIILLVVILLFFFIIPPTTLLVIFLGVLFITLIFSNLAFLATYDKSKTAIVGLSTFFLLALQALAVLDLVTMSILVSFIVILSIFLLKKDPIELKEK